MEPEEVSRTSADLFVPGQTAVSDFSSEIPKTPFKTMAHVHSISTGFSILLIFEHTRTRQNFKTILRKKQEETTKNTEQTAYPYRHASGILRSAP